MSSPYISQIQMWGCNFAPRGWAFCNGQILPISQYNALFALIGTTFGGNGSSTLGLPNFQGRMPVGMGSGAGLTPRVLGQMSGSETITLTLDNLPTHNHAPIVRATPEQGTISTPSSGAYLSTHSDPSGTIPAINAYASTPASIVSLGGVSESNVGGNQPIGKMPPYLAINFTIALEGFFPTRS